MSTDFLRLRQKHIDLLQKQRQRRDSGLDSVVEKEARTLVSALRSAAESLEESSHRQRLESYATFWASSIAEKTGLYPFPRDGTMPQGGTPAFMVPDAPSAEPVGRRKFLENMREALIAGGSLAFYGPPGLGKTSIAAWLARDPQLRERFPDGVLWASLGEDPDVLSLLSTWGEQLGIHQDLVGFVGVDERKEVIREAIGSRRMLLVADDAWDFESALAFKCGGPNCVHVMTTYLMPVAVRFDTPGATDVPALDDRDALQLLRFVFSRQIPYPEEQVKELVKLTEGLPLSLSLLGRSLRAAGPKEPPARLEPLLHDLEDAKKRFEETGPASRPSGRRTGRRADAQPALLAAIDVCFRRLGDTPQRMLRALSVFRPKSNSFSELAALSVSDGKRQTLHALESSGLLERTSNGRYMLHRAIHQYLQHPAVAQPNPARWDDLIAHYVKQLEKSATGHSVLDQDGRNIFSALENAHRLAEAGGLEEACRQPYWSLVLRGARAVFPYLDSRALFGKAKRYLSYAQQAAALLADELGQTTVLVELGDMEEKLGEYDAAVEHLTAALKGAREHHGKALAPEATKEYADLECRALQVLGVVAYNLADYSWAESRLLEGLKVAEARGDSYRTGAILMRLGWVECSRGDDGKARMYARNALRALEQAGKPGEMAMVKLDLGVLAFYEGNYRRGQKLDREALKAAEECGDRKLQCAAHQALLGVETKLGNYERAARHAQEAVQLSRAIGSKWYEGVTSKELGELMLVQRKPEAAANCFGRALEIAAHLDSPDLQAFATYGLARLAHQSANGPEARRLGYSSLRLFQEVGHRKAKEVEGWLNVLETESPGGTASAPRVQEAR